MSGEQPASPAVHIVETPVDPNELLQALSPTTQPAKADTIETAHSRISELEATNASLQKGMLPTSHEH